MTRLDRFFVSVVLLASVTCSDPSSEPSIPDADIDVHLDGLCDDAERVGGFEIFERPEDTTVSGFIAEAVAPTTLQVEVASAGPCRLLQPDVPVCDPLCEAGLVCDFNGQCVEYPENIDVGTVSIRGLADPVQMLPTSMGNHYFATELSHPAFLEGTPIELTARGHGLESEELMLHGLGVAPLERSRGTWQVRAGQPLEITWAPASRVESTVIATLNVDQHGRTPATLVCTGPDNGSMTVGSELVDRMLELGISGSPRGSLMRVTGDSADIGAGCVELTVASVRDILVDLDRR